MEGSRRESGRGLQGAVWLEHGCCDGTVREAAVVGMERTVLVGWTAARWSEWSAVAAACRDEGRMRRACFHRWSEEMDQAGEDGTIGGCLCGWRQKPVLCERGWVCVGWWAASVVCAAMT